MAIIGMRCNTAFNRAAVCLAALGAMGLVEPAHAQTSDDAVTVPTYVGSQACADCHAEISDVWAGSHHALAWTQPDESNVLGDFDNASLTHRGVTTTFTREGDVFFIESDGPDGMPTRWPVAGVVGVAPLQQYVVETEPGRQQSFDITWDVEQDRWYHLYPDQHLPAGDGFHWTGPYKTWNARCAECHATDYSRNYDPVSQSYASVSGEIGVGCEACHGPGSAHLAWAEAQDANGDFMVPAELSPAGFTIDLASGDPETEIQQCAACHSRRGPYLDGSPLPGTPYHDAYRLSTLRAPLYHPDGQILDEVYVYGSFLQSKMYAEGVTCSDCHDVHDAGREMAGNQTCVACHSPAGNPDFPSLRLADYDTPEHHFHAQDSEGAQCVSCHMIERTYMGIDGRRDHSFRVPRPDLSIATGAPNACTDCHASEGPYWAQAELDARFPESTYRGDHFSLAFYAAQQGDPKVAGELAEIARADDLPGIVRATALELLAPMATPDIAEGLVALLDDPDPLVRTHVLSVQRAATPPDMVMRLLPRLRDESRSVRIAAAREILGAPIAHLPDADAAALSAAMGEWQASLADTADFPETQLVLGGIGLSTRNVPAALSAFREAVRMDPQLVQAWSMIVRLEAATGNDAAARTALTDALSHVPDDPALNALAQQFP